MYLLFISLYGAVRNSFEADNIHYEGHWKGWAWKQRLFWALKWLRAKRVPFQIKDRPRLFCNTSNYRHRTKIIHIYTTVHVSALKTQIGPKTALL